jgi:hypothetical protein
MARPSTDSRSPERFRGRLVVIPRSDPGEVKIADLKAQIEARRDPPDVARIRLSVGRDPYRRASTHIVRSAFEFCVRTVSDTPRNPGQTP